MYIFFQRKQLSIILTSMQDDRHIATLLGFSGMIKDEETLFGTQKDLGERHNSKLTDVLLKTLLRNLSFHVVCHLYFCFNFYVIGCKLQVMIILVNIWQFLSILTI